MINTFWRIAIPCCAFAFFGACNGSSSEFEEATGEGSIRGLHAIADLGSLRFLIEETTLASLDYKDVSAINDYDNLTYEFNFDILLPDDSDYTRLATYEQTIAADNEYTFVLTGSLAEPEVFVWEQFGRDWDAALDDAEENDEEITILDVSFGHAAQTVGEIDFFLSAPGTAPFDGGQAATLASSELQTSEEYEEGEYQLVMTNAGDASTYLFASEPFTLSSATSVMFVLMDGDDSSTGEFGVRLIGSGSGTELVDINATTTLRVVHGAYNTEAVDVIAGDDFSSPIAGNVAFSTRTEPAIVDDGELNLNVTPAGNPGVFLAEEQADLDKGGRYTLYLNGLPGQLTGVIIKDTPRQLATHAKLRIYQAAARFGSLDVYLVSADSDISLVSPYLSSFAYTGSTGYVSVVPDSYDIIYTMPGTKTIVAGPLRRNLEAQQIYDVVTVDTAQTDRANVLFLSEF